MVMSRLGISLLLSSLLFAALPSSANYGIHNYGFGSGGTSNSTSSNYGLNATTGQTSNVQSSSATYQAKIGNQNAQQSYVPPAPTFTNPASYYDRLLIVINPGTNPSTAKFSIAVSSDGFTTTQYVRPDGTLSSSFAVGDLQTFSAWGGSSGQLILGLSPNTTYQAKVNSMTGAYTETQYGSAASATTSVPSISFSIYTDSQSTPPFVTTIGTLLPATVVNSADKLWFNLTTNADNGAMVYISSSNAGLTSTHSGYTIASASADLASASTGYGAQVQSATQTSGGPLTIVSPFNGSAQTVGGLTTGFQQIFTASAPITGANGSILFKARAAATTPASDDYQDKVSLIGAGSF
jgi:hypothetical protein